jgi:hypothetical protein
MWAVSAQAANPREGNLLIRTPAPEQAVLSAIRGAEGGATPVRVVRVAAERDWLTAAELADRIGRSRQSIDQLARGERGPGGFPAPVARRGARSTLFN